MGNCPNDPVDTRNKLVKSISQEHKKAQLIAQRLKEKLEKIQEVEMETKELDRQRAKQKTELEYSRNSVKHLEVAHDVLIQYVSSKRTHLHALKESLDKKTKLYNEVRERRLTISNACPGEYKMLPYIPSYHQEEEEEMEMETVKQRNDPLAQEMEDLQEGISQCNRFKALNESVVKMVPFKKNTLANEALVAKQSSLRIPNEGIEIRKSWRRHSDESGGASQWKEGTTHTNGSFTKSSGDDARTFCGNNSTVTQL